MQGENRSQVARFVMKMAGLFALCLLLMITFNGTANAGLTCAQLRAEIVQLTRTIAKDEQLLEKCKHNPCTAEQISQLKKLGAAYEKRLKEDEASILEICRPPLSGVNPFQGVTNAELLVIAPNAFLPAVQPLVQHKTQSGIPTFAVTIEGLKQYFPGVDDPERIKFGIIYANQNLNTKYVMLVGDAQAFPVRYEFLHGLSVGYPSTNVPVPIDGSYLPSDLYYANLYHHNIQSGVIWGNLSNDTWDLNGNGLYNEGTWLDFSSNPDNIDGYPDVALGRVPAHTVADVTSYMNKIIRYESAWKSGFWFTFVGDQNYGALNWSTDIVSSSGLTQPTFFALINNAPNQAPQPWFNSAGSDVAAKANGSIWVSYIGHGWAHGWDGGDFGENMVQQTSNNNAFPVVFAAGCSTGHFARGGPFDGDEYMDVSSQHHRFSVVPGSQPNVDGPVIIDTISGQTWGRNCAGCSPLPLTGPKPNPYDFNRSNLSFDYPWLISYPQGGAIAYFGEVGITTDTMGKELEAYILTEYQQRKQAVLGDIYLAAERQYWKNHQNYNPGDVYHTIPRYYLGWMTLFGDPSLRLPEL